MPLSHLPPFLTSTFTALAHWLHQRSAARLPRLLIGILFATGRRTVTAWLRAAGRHNAWMEGKKFLLVPYHMIGAHSMESGVLGGYVDFIRRTHPKAPVPGVFLAERLFDDARHLRQTMGDGP